MSDNVKKKPDIRFEGFVDDWEELRLGELSGNTFGGGTPKTSIPEYWEGTIPWIQSSDLITDELFNIVPNKYITDVAVKDSATKLVPANSIAIVTRVGVGKIAFMPFQYTTSQDFLSLSNLNIDNIFSMFSIYRILQKELNNIQGTSIKGITKPDLLAKIISVPIKIEEQKKIGIFFKQLDTVITLHQQKLELLKKTKKGYLQKMFPKNGETVPEIRFEGFSGEWEQGQLKDILNISKEKNKSEKYSREQVLSVSREAGTVNQIEYQGRSFAGANISGYKVVKPNQMIYTKSPLKGAPYGIFQKVTVEGIVSPLYAVYDSTEKALASFISLQLKDDNLATHYLSPLVSKGAKNTINITDEGALMGKVYYPSKSEQSEIVDFFSKYDIALSQQQKQLELLKSLKKSLLQKMFI